MSVFKPHGKKKVPCSHLLILLDLIICCHWMNMSTWFHSQPHFFYLGPPHTFRQPQRLQSGLGDFNFVSTKCLPKASGLFYVYVIIKSHKFYFLRCSVIGVVCGDAVWFKNQVVATEELVFRGAMRSMLVPWPRCSSVLVRQPDFHAVNNLHLNQFLQYELGHYHNQQESVKPFLLFLPAYKRNSTWMTWYLCSPQFSTTVHSFFMVSF